MGLACLLILAGVSVSSRFGAVVKVNLLSSFSRAEWQEGSLSPFTGVSVINLPQQRLFKRPQLLFEARCCCWCCLNSSFGFHSKSSND